MQAEIKIKTSVTVSLKNSVELRMNYHLKGTLALKEIEAEAGITVTWTKMTENMKSTEHIFKKTVKPGTKWILEQVLHLIHMCICA